MFAISYPSNCIDIVGGHPTEPQNALSCTSYNSDVPGYRLQPSDMNLHVQPEPDDGRPLVDDDPQAQEVTVDGMGGRFAFYRPGDPQWQVDDFGQQLIAHAAFPLPKPVPWGKNNQRTLTRISFIMWAGSDTEEFRELFSTIIRSLELPR